MTDGLRILLVEDEPLIVIDLQFAAEDRGCELIACGTSKSATDTIATLANAIDVAILDVSLAEGETCFAAANALAELGIPYLLHSGELHRLEERLAELDAEFIAKPAAADAVIGAAISLAYRSRHQAADRDAAE